MFRGLAIGGLFALLACSRTDHTPMPPLRYGTAPPGQKKLLIAGHSRRQPSFQATWTAPDGALGYTVYIATPCPAPLCQVPNCQVSPDGGPDGGPIIIAACPCTTNSVGGRGVLNVDAGTCSCLNDAGRPLCVSGGTIKAEDIADGGCANTALCCVKYPGTPAPAGQHDGIVVSQCYASNTPDGAPIQTDGGRCCVHGTCWYPPPNFPTDGGFGTPDGQAPYSGTCWIHLLIEHPYCIDVETNH